MKNITKKSLGFEVPVSGYANLPEVAVQAGSEQAAIDRLNTLLLNAQTNDLKAAVVNATAEASGEKPADKESADAFVTRASKGKEDAVKAILAKTLVTLSIKPQPRPGGRAAKPKPVPQKWQDEALSIITSKVLPKGASGVPALEAYLKSKGLPAWAPDTTKPLNDPVNVEKLGRCVQAERTTTFGGLN